MEITLTYTCVICRQKNKVNYPLEGFRKWCQGELVQRALPNISPTDREVLITNFCPKCQDEIFGADE